MPRNNVKLLLVYFAVYYFAQGIYNAYGSFEQPYLRANGVSLTDVSTSKAVSKIPWSVKILMAIPTDWLGRRLPFATVGMISGATCLAIVSSFNPGRDYPTYVATVFLRNLGIAISDVAVDGMSVDVGMPQLAGSIQAVMSLGRVSGTLIGSAVGGKIVGSLGYPAVILFLAGIIFAIVPISCFMREEKAPKGQGQGGDKGSPAAEEKFEWGAFRELLRTPVLCFLGYACVGNLSGTLGGTAGTEWAQTVVGMSVEDLGYLSTVGSIGDLIGALGTGWIFDRADRRWVMAASCILATVTNLVCLWTKDKAGWYALGFFSGIASGSLFVSNCATVLTLADPRVGASVFAIAVSCMNFSQMIGDSIGGPLAEKSLEAAFWASGIVNILQLPFVPFIIPVVRGGTDSKGKVGEEGLSPGLTPASGSGSGAEDEKMLKPAGLLTNALGNGNKPLVGTSWWEGQTVAGAGGADGGGPDTPIVVMNALHPVAGAGAGVLGRVEDGQVANPYSPAAAAAQARTQEEAGQAQPLERTAAEVVGDHLTSLVNRTAALSSAKFAPVAPTAASTLVPATTAAAQNQALAARRLEQLRALQASTAVQPPPLPLPPGYTMVPVTAGMGMGVGMALVTAVPPGGGDGDEQTHVHAHAAFTGMHMQGPGGLIAGSHGVAMPVPAFVHAPAAGEHGHSFHGGAAQVPNAYL